MNKIFIIFIIFFIIFLLLGCISVDVQQENKMTTLEIENSTPYEIKHVYLKPSQGIEWGPDVLADKSILPFSTIQINIEHGSYILKAEVLVNNEMMTVDDSLESGSGKRYLWTISEEVLIGMFNGEGEYMYLDSYDYLDSYEYLDTYGYMDTYGFMDTYGYM